MNAFHLYGIEVPRQVARDALDGTTVFEAATNLPVRRWRTQREVTPSHEMTTVAAAIRRHPAGNRLTHRVPEHLRTDDIQDYLRQKGEIQ